MKENRIDELRQSIQLFETNNPEIAHILSLLNDLTDIVAMHAYKLDVELKLSKLSNKEPEKVKVDTDKIKVEIHLTTDELLHLQIYIGDTNSLIDAGYRETEVENMIEEAFKIDNNSDDPNFPNTAYRILAQVWDAVQEQT